MAILFHYKNALAFMKKSEVENFSEFVKVSHEMFQEKNIFTLLKPGYKINKKLERLKGGK